MAVLADFGGNSPSDSCKSFHLFLGGPKIAPTPHYIYLDAQIFLSILEWSGNGGSQTAEDLPFSHHKFNQLALPRIFTKCTKDFLTSREHIC
jgi:hypothetical protein